MFGIINNLNPNAPAYGPVPEDGEARSEELIRRARLVGSFVKKLGLRAGVAPEKVQEVPVLFGSSFLDASVKGKGSTITMQVPLLLFIDFVRDFQVQNLEELLRLLDTDEGMGTVCRRIAQIFNGTPLEVNEENRNIIRSYVEHVFHEPIKAFDALRFSILHEYGHLENDDIGFSTSLIRKLWLIAGTLLFVFFPVLGIGYLISATVASLEIALLIATVASVAVAILQLRSLERGEESRADRFAAEALPGAEGERIRQGGIYFFGSMVPEDKRSCLDRFMDPHPTDEERIEMLQNLQMNPLPDLQAAHA